MHHRQGTDGRMITIELAAPGYGKKGKGKRK
jgi:hypothetical protein